jgi:hypothetical protein
MRGCVRVCIRMCVRACICDVLTGLIPFDGHVWVCCTGGVLSCSWQGESHFVTSSVDNTVQLFSIAAEAPIAVIRAHSNEVNVVCCQSSAGAGASGA